ncbi:ABC transporter ATP-binding protein [Streptomyces sp. NPDC059101]|uniref:ABC transporter ATP-binding protein n=1 Tax=unclassified Streptomyces TaxID=2593676 RepID=UPI0036C26656
MGQGDRPDHGKSQSGAVAAALRSAPERLEEGRDPGSPPLRILHGIDLTVEAGELLAVVGPSGSGKSTLLALLGSLDRPTGRQLRFEERELSGLSDPELAALRAHRIGFVFQQFFLLPGLTAVENVATGLLYSGAHASRRRAAAVDLLRTLNGNGTTVVVITHDRELTASFPRRIGIHDGRIDFDEQGPQPAGAAL